MNKYLVKVARRIQEEEKDESVSPLLLGTGGLALGALGGAAIGKTKGLARGLKRSEEFLNKRYAPKQLANKQEAARLHDEAKRIVAPVMDDILATKNWDPSINKERNDRLIAEAKALYQKSSDMTAARLRREDTTLPQHLHKLVVEPNKRSGTIVGGLVGGAGGASLGLGTAYLYNRTEK